MKISGYSKSDSAGVTCPTLNKARVIKTMRMAGLDLQCSWWGWRDGLT